MLYMLVAVQCYHTIRLQLAKVYSFTIAMTMLLMFAQVAMQVAVVHSTNNTV